MNFTWLAGLPTIWGTVLHTAVWVLLAIWAWRQLADSRALRWSVVALAVIQIGLYWVF